MRRSTQGVPFPPTKIHFNEVWSMIVWSVGSSESPSGSAQIMKLMLRRSASLGVAGEGKESVSVTVEGKGTKMNSLFFASPCDDGIPTSVPRTASPRHS